MYYLRTKVAKTQQFTLDPSKAGGNLGNTESGSSTGGADEVCESCSG